MSYDLRYNLVLSGRRILGKSYKSTHSIIVSLSQHLSPLYVTWFKSLQFQGKKHQYCQIDSLRKQSITSLLRIWYKITLRKELMHMSLHDMR